MKRKIVYTIAGATGVLSSSFIFQACNQADSADELNQMLQSNTSTNQDEVGTQIGIPMSKQDQNYICFLHQLSADIVKNPKIATEFANNPDAYCSKYGYTQHINLDQGLLKLIMALGDKKINDSINNGDVNSFIKACKENGVIEFNSLKRDPYLKKLSDIIQKDKLSSKFKQPIYLSRTSEEASVNNIDNFSVIYGAVAIVIAAVAVEAFIVIGTTTWVTHVHESSNKDIKKYKQYKNNAVEVWDLKNEGKTDFAITDKIDDAIIEEGFTIIKDNYPEVYNSIDKNTLRNLILLNVSKNLYYEN